MLSDSRATCCSGACVELGGGDTAATMRSQAYGKATVKTTTKGVRQNARKKTDQNETVLLGGGGECTSVGYTAAPVEESTSFKFGWVKKGGKTHTAPALVLLASGGATQESRSRPSSTYRELPRRASAIRRPGSGFSLFSGRLFVVLLSQHANIPSLPRVHVGIPLLCVT